MAITRLNPNTIYLGGPRTEINDIGAKAAITPGMLVERVNTSGVLQWQKHATAGGANARSVATEQSMINKGISDDYATGDLVEVSEGAGGTSFLMFIASGQAIVHGQKLESAGDGTLRALASGVALFQAIENKTNNGSGGAGSLVRIRVEVV